MNRIQQAEMMCMTAHTACRQVRKFSGLPYHTHPFAVRDILLAHFPEAPEDMQIAALLHDVDEDTGAGKLVELYFGRNVSMLVEGLTNRKVPGLNRAQQKQFDARRLVMQDWRVKLIKLCDRLHNLPDIIANDPKHAKVYVPETRYLLDTALIGVGLLGGAGYVLWFKLDAIVRKYYEENACQAA